MAHPAASLAALWEWSIVLNALCACRWATSLILLQILSYSLIVYGYHLCNVVFSVYCLRLLITIYGC
ncbi:hypothetical protein HMPREF0973_02337 [Prevotella veroralis F0319]|uniref:Uncharacterized protein n=1 Tax=Prevotella veroralis F0319 TaxID=649761 RepID=C9MRS5_9BACT|nr:hypothetical protein HMPREF0973_02337 [Prevotella veroralis F0319]